MHAIVTEFPQSKTKPLHWSIAKRVTDIVAGCAILILAAPLLLCASLAIMLVSPGSPIFAQERVGKDGRAFKIYKLRTMRSGAHLEHDRMRACSEVSGPVFKMRRDPRLHALGAALRRSSIDELPNFVNVVRGEMSIVGPRPPLPCEVLHYTQFARRRLSVKPGITCLWQIQGRSNVAFEEWIRLDNLYIDTWTPLTDLKIIAATVPAVLRGDGAH